MSEEEPKSTVAHWWTRIVAIPKTWSVPVWATIGLATFLIGCLIACWGWFQHRHQYVPWYHYLTWDRLLVVVTLLVAAPYLFYHGLRLWLLGEASRFPELEKAWQAGMHALSEAGITLDSTPVFLCLGSNDELQERAIMNSNATPLSVVGVPKGPAPIHWYGNSEAVYLFCTDASWLSALNRLRREREDEAAESGASESQLPLAGLGIAGDRGSELAAAKPLASPQNGNGNGSSMRAAENGGNGASLRLASPQSPVASQPAGTYRGTMMLDQFVSEASPGRAIAVPASSGGSVRGTLMLEESDTNIAVQEEPDSLPAPEATLHQRQPVLVAARDVTIRLRRLQAACQYLRNARRPLCPINGILALLPFELIHATAEEMEELERAVRNDLDVVRDELSLRAPVTTLVVGLEKESGFRELVRRVGREKSATQRFGGRFDTRAVAAADHLRSFSSHVCGAFEDWAYTLFRAKGALSRPGNTRLYSLLCKVRCVLKHKLGRLLANGIGFDARQTNAGEPHLFSGCYFAATGRSADRQAFTRGVLEKLVAEQEQIEWTDQAVALDRRCRQLYYLGIILDVALLSLLVYLWQQT